MIASSPNDPLSAPTPSSGAEEDVNREPASSEDAFSVDATTEDAEDDVTSQPESRLELLKARISQERQRLQKRHHKHLTHAIMHSLPPESPTAKTVNLQGLDIQQQIEHLKAQIAAEQAQDAADNDNDSGGGHHHDEDTDDEVVITNSRAVTPIQANTSPMLRSVTPPTEEKRNPISQLPSHYLTVSERVEAFLRQEVSRGQHQDPSTDDTNNNNNNSTPNRQYDEQIKRLQQELRHKTEEAATIKQTLEAQAAEMEALRRTNSELEGRVDAQRQDGQAMMEELDTKIVTLQTHLAREQADNKVLSQRVAKKQQEDEEKNAQIQSFRQELQSISAQLQDQAKESAEASQAQHEHDTETVSALKAQVSKLEADLVVATQEKKRLQVQAAKAIEAAQARHSQDQQVMGILKAQVSKLQSDLGAAALETEMLQTVVEQAVGDQKAKQAQVVDLEARVSELTAFCDQQDADLRRQREESAQQAERVAALQVDQVLAFTLKEKTQELEAALHDVKTEADRRQTLLVQAQQDERASQAKVEETASVVARLEAQLQEKNAEIALYDKKCRLQEQSIHELEEKSTAILDLTVKTSQLESQLTKVQSQAEHDKELLFQAEQEKRAQVTKTRQVQATLEELQLQIQDKDQQISAWDDRFRQQDAKLQEKERESATILVLTEQTTQLKSSLAQAKQETAERQQRLAQTEEAKLETEAKATDLQGQLVALKAQLDKKDATLALIEQQRNEQAKSIIVLQEEKSAVAHDAKQTVELEAAANDAKSQEMEARFNAMAEALLTKERELLKRDQKCLDQASTIKDLQTQMENLEESYDHTLDELTQQMTHLEASLESQARADANQEETAPAEQSGGGDISGFEEQLEGLMTKLMEKEREVESLNDHIKSMVKEEEEVPATAEATDDNADLKAKLTEKEREVEALNDHIKRMVEEEESANVESTGDLVESTNDIDSSANEEDASPLDEGEDSSSSSSSEYYSDSSEDSDENDSETGQPQDNEASTGSRKRSRRSRRSAPAPPEVLPTIEEDQPAHVDHPETFQIKTKLLAIGQAIEEQDHESVERMLKSMEGMTSYIADLEERLALSREEVEEVMSRSLLQDARPTRSKRKNRALIIAAIIAAVAAICSSVCFGMWVGSVHVRGSEPMKRQVSPSIAKEPTVASSEASQPVLSGRGVALEEDAPVLEPVETPTPTDDDASPPAESFNVEDPSEVTLFFSLPSIFRSVKDKVGISSLAKHTTKAIRSARQNPQGTVSKALREQSVISFYGALLTIAADAVAKPFSPRRLSSRIEAATATVQSVRDGSADTISRSLKQGSIFRFYGGILAMTSGHILGKDGVVMALPRLVNDVLARVHGKLERTALVAHVGKAIRSARDHPSATVRRSLQEGSILSFYGALFTILIGKLIPARA